MNCNLCLLRKIVEKLIFQYICPYSTPQLLKKAILAFPKEA